MQHTKFYSQICIPIRSTTTKATIKLIKKAQKKADIVEVWIDHIEDLNLPKLISSASKPLLIVNKTPEEQGKWAGTEEKRTELLKQSAQLGAKYVDIGIQTQPQLIKDLRSFLDKNAKSTDLIISFHDFKETPSDKELNDIIEKAKSFKADIIKIATKLNSHSDSLRLLGLLEKQTSKGQKVIFLGMGPLGKLNRIYSSYIGNFLTFVPLDPKRATAPGQVSYRDLQIIRNIL